MKCRIPSRKRLSRQELEACNEYIKEQNVKTTRRIFKLFCYCLNSDFKFGKGNLMKLMSSVQELVAESEKDEVFWEHIDTFLIDQKHLSFSREQYESVFKEAK